MERPPFVDAHIHLWDLARLEYPWLKAPFSEEGPNGSVEAIARNYLIDDYLSDADGWDVRGVVHVEAGAAPQDALRETIWLQEVAAGRGMPSGIVAFAALNDPRVKILLEAHVEYGGIRGIRHIVNHHEDPRLTYSRRDVTEDEAWARGFGMLSRHELSFDLQCYPHQMSRVAKIAAIHPETPLIVNHMGMPIPSEPEGLKRWRTGMRALADLPNAAVKISGMGFFFRPWSVEQIAPLILETIELFGARRCMFASDFPTDKLFGGFDETLDAYSAVTSSFSLDERRDLFGRNADRIYRLGLNI